MNVQISSRMFPKGFDITTPLENFYARWSPYGELLISNASGTQIARLGKESFFGNFLNHIIISGGGFYQFFPGKHSSRLWGCRGEGRLLHVSEHKGRRFEIADETHKIAECSTAWFDSDYSITVADKAELKLVICIFLALRLSEQTAADIPG